MVTTWCILVILKKNQLIKKSMFQDEVVGEEVESELIEAFISRWQNADGTERANYQIFLTELCEVLGVTKPTPAAVDNAKNSYVFERAVEINRPDGTVSRGFIDLYKKDCFVLEAKQTGRDIESEGWDRAMLAAQNQADNYVRALPADEGRPPFIVVTDVGRSIELYAEFTCSGGTYVPYPDPRNHRILIEELRNPEIQQRLIKLWEKPEALDPSKYSARVTREISANLAELARSLEAEGYEVERVAHFLKRCLFSMFSEDVGLLPKNSFTSFLEAHKSDPQNFTHAIKSLWETMNTGGYSPVLNKTLKMFNGGLFVNIDPIPLKSHQIALLIQAAKADWRYVEPAIFGTLLERALDPKERHKFGAHYTPREYVERLVMPTIIDPLRKEWKDIQVVAETWLQKGKVDKAIAELKKFHMKLCEIRVLDPACGSSNFLYVTLEHMKRLEGEVLNLIGDLSGGQGTLSTDRLTVDPHQFLGIEVNPRAAAVAEIVLWIGYLQWHYRINGQLDLPEPILRDFHNIECRDALIDYDAREPMKDENGSAITIWDGISYKSSPVTGELVPDDSQRKSVYHYINPTKAEWPQADYIVGNPPFIGKLKIREALGDGYVDAIREVYGGKVPDSADLVMYWWFIAANIVASNKAERFGFITTNSIKQVFNRKITEPFLGGKKKAVSLIFAVPDHPWVDSTDGAAVRIAMTVGAAGEKEGELWRSTFEESVGEAKKINFEVKKGVVHSNLKVGANVSSARPLKSNLDIVSVGVMLHGQGFVLDSEEAKALGYESDDSVKRVIKEYRNGIDILQKPRGKKVIDLFPLGLDEVKSTYPEVYQWIKERVKPERDQNRMERRRKFWWIHGDPAKQWRPMVKGLGSYFATAMTAKHRIFTTLDEGVLPDQGLVAIALREKHFLGVLQSRIHVAWALAAGGTLEDRPRYNKTICFEPFPFPVLSEGFKREIGELAEKIECHRRGRQSLHEGLTLTGIYNVLEKMRSGETLTAKEKDVNQKGLVTTLMELHDELDRKVFEAYGWPDLAGVLVGKPGATVPLLNKSEDQAEAEEEMLIRLVAINQKRAAEEVKGQVLWLRPGYQESDALKLGVENRGKDEEQEEGVVALDKAKPVWPKELSDQVQAVKEFLGRSSCSLEDLSSQFKRKPMKSVGQVLSALEVLGQAKNESGVWSLQ